MMDGRKTPRTTPRREPISSTIMVASALAGGGMMAKNQIDQNKQLKAAKAAQAEQATAIAAEQAKVKAVADGQKAAAQTGGGGLLAYIDPEARAGRLKSTLG